MPPIIICHFWMPRPNFIKFSKSCSILFFFKEQSMMNKFVTSKKIEAKNTIVGGDNEVESGGASFR